MQTCFGAFYCGEIKQFQYGSNVKSPINIKHTLQLVLGKHCDFSLATGAM